MRERAVGKRWEFISPHGSIAAGLIPCGLFSLNPTELKSFTYETRFIPMIIQFPPCFREKKLTFKLRIKENVYGP